MSELDGRKRDAAAAAVALVESGMRVGLGTGSTAKHVVELLAAALRRGDLRDIVAVPTSVATESLATGLGIPLATLDEVTSLDITIDGADEIDPRLDLIKGLGGALLWEKIVARASARVVIVADDSKLVDTLGTRAPLPVEVVPFGWRTHLAHIERLGGEPSLRAVGTAPFRTDSGHLILDVRFSDGIADAPLLEAALRARAGVVETGLFLGIADTAIVTDSEGVRIRERVRT